VIIRPVPLVGKEVFAAEMVTDRLIQARGTWGHRFGWQHTSFFLISFL